MISVSSLLVAHRSLRPSFEAGFLCERCPSPFPSALLTRYTLRVLGRALLLYVALLRSVDYTTPELIYKKKKKSSLCGEYNVWTNKLFPAVLTGPGTDCHAWHGASPRTRTERGCRARCVGRHAAWSDKIISYIVLSFPAQCSGISRVLSLSLTHSQLASSDGPGHRRSAPVIMGRTHETRASKDQSALE